MNRPAPHPWPGLLTVGLGASIAPLDFAVNVAFPAITAAFALDMPSIRWLVICYVITYASLMLAFGKLGDVAGHRRVFRAGLVIGTLAFAACAMAATYPWLLAARVLQGIATALVLSCAPALVVAICGEDRRTWALSRYAMITALAGIIGPIIGGFAIQWLGWAGVFWFRLPLALLALALLARLPELPTAGTTQRRFHPVSSALLASGLALLLLSSGLWSGTTHAAAPLATAIAGAVLLGLFALREHRDTTPLLPATLRGHGMLFANMASVIVNLVGFSIPLLVPYYLARIGGFDAGNMGLLLAMSMVGMFASSTYTPQVVRTLGQRRAALLGAALITLGQGAIALWPLTPSIVVLVAALLLHGLGMGLFQVSYTDLIVAALPASHRGVAGSLTTLTRTIGVIIAAALLSSVLQTLEAHHLATGQSALGAFHMAFSNVFQYSALLLAALLALGFLRTGPVRT